MEKGKDYNNTIYDLARVFNKAYEKIAAGLIKVSEWLNKIIKKGILRKTVSKMKRKETPWPAVIVEVRVIESDKVKQKKPKEEIERKRLYRIALKTKKFRIKKKLLKRLSNIC